MKEKSSENKPERNEDGTLKPGNTANPNGRPKGTGGTRGLTEAVRMKINKRVDPTDPDSKTYKEEIVQSIIEDAKEGQTKARKLLWNHLDGKPTQKTDITSDGEPINFVMPSEIAEKNDVKDN